MAERTTCAALFRVIGALARAHPAAMAQDGRAQTYFATAVTELVNAHKRDASGVGERALFEGILRGVGSFLAEFPEVLQNTASVDLAGGRAALSVAPPRNYSNSNQSSSIAAQQQHQRDAASEAATAAVVTAFVQLNSCNPALGFTIDDGSSADASAQAQALNPAAAGTRVNPRALLLKSAAMLIHVVRVGTGSGKVFRYEPIIVAAQFIARHAALMPQETVSHFSVLTGELEEVVVCRYADARTAATIALEALLHQYSQSALAAWTAARGSGFGSSSSASAAAAATSGHAAGGSAASASAVQAEVDAKVLHYRRELRDATRRLAEGTAAPAPFVLTAPAAAAVSAAATAGASAVASAAAAATSSSVHASVSELLHSASVATRALGQLAKVLVAMRGAALGELLLQDLESAAEAVFFGSPQTADLAAGHFAAYFRAFSLVLLSLPSVEQRHCEFVARLVFRFVTLFPAITSLRRRAVESLLGLLAVLAGNEALLALVLDRVVPLAFLRATVSRTDAQALFTPGGGGESQDANIMAAGLGGAQQGEDGAVVPRTLPSAASRLISALTRSSAIAANADASGAGADGSDGGDLGGDSGGGVASAAAAALWFAPAASAAYRRFVPYSANTRPYAAYVDLWLSLLTGRDDRGYTYRWSEGLMLSPETAAQLVRAAQQRVFDAMLSVWTQTVPSLELALVVVDEESQATLELSQAVAARGADGQYQPGSTQGALSASSSFSFNNGNNGASLAAAAAVSTIITNSSSGSSSGSAGGDWEGGGAAGVTGVGAGSAEDVSCFTVDPRNIAPLSPADLSMLANATELLLGLLLGGRRAVDRLDAGTARAPQPAADTAAAAATAIADAAASEHLGSDCTDANGETGAVMSPHRAMQEWFRPWVPVFTVLLDGMTQRHPLLVAPHRLTAAVLTVADRIGYFNSNSASPSLNSQLRSSATAQSQQQLVPRGAALITRTQPSLAPSPTALLTVTAFALRCLPRLPLLSPPLLWAHLLSLLSLPRAVAGPAALRPAVAAALGLGRTKAAAAVLALTVIEGWTALPTGSNAPAVSTATTAAEQEAAAVTLSLLPLFLPYLTPPPPPPPASLAPLLSTRPQSGFTIPGAPLPGDDSDDDGDATALADGTGDGGGADLNDGDDDGTGGFVPAPPGTAPGSAALAASATASATAQSTVRASLAERYRAETALSLEAAARVAGVGSAAGVSRVAIAHRMLAIMGRAGAGSRLVVAGAGAGAGATGTQAWLSDAVAALSGAVTATSAVAAAVAGGRGLVAGAGGMTAAGAAAAAARFDSLATAATELRRLGDVTFNTGAGVVLVDNDDDDGNARTRGVVMDDGDGADAHTAVAVRARITDITNLNEDDEHDGADDGNGAGCSSDGLLAVGSLAVGGLTFLGGGGFNSVVNPRGAAAAVAVTSAAGGAAATSAAAGADAGGAAATVPDATALSVSLDAAAALSPRVPLPFPAHSLSLSLDAVTGAVAALAEAAPSRATQIAAAEGLHALLLLALAQADAAEASTGTGPNAPVKGARAAAVATLFPLALRLAVSSEGVVRQLFAPLVGQIVHWACILALSVQPRGAAAQAAAAAAAAESRSEGGAGRKKTKAVAQAQEKEQERPKRGRTAAAAALSAPEVDATHSNGSVLGDDENDDNASEYDGDDDEDDYESESESDSDDDDGDSKRAANGQRGANTGVPLWERDAVDPSAPGLTSFTPELTVIADACLAALLAPASPSALRSAAADAVAELLHWGCALTAIPAASDDADSSSEQQQQQRGMLVAAATTASASRCVYSLSDAFAPYSSSTAADSASAPSSAAAVARVRKPARVEPIARLMARVLPLLSSPLPGPRLAALALLARTHATLSRAPYFLYRFALPLARALMAALARAPADPPAAGAAAGARAALLRLGQALATAPSEVLALLLPVARAERRKRKQLEQGGALVPNSDDALFASFIDLFENQIQTAPDSHITPGTPGDAAANNLAALALSQRKNRAGGEHQHQRLRFGLELGSSSNSAGGGSNGASDGAAQGQGQGIGQGLLLSSARLAAPSTRSLFAFASWLFPLIAAPDPLLRQQAFVLFIATAPRCRPARTLLNNNCSTGASSESSGEMAVSSSPLGRARDWVQRLALTVGWAHVGALLEAAVGSGAARPRSRKATPADASTSGNSGTVNNASSTDGTSSSTGANAHAVLRTPLMPPLWLLRACGYTLPSDPQKQASSGAQSHSQPQTPEVQSATVFTQWLSSVTATVDAYHALIATGLALPEQLFALSPLHAATAGSERIAMSAHMPLMWTAVFVVLQLVASTATAARDITTARYTQASGGCDNGSDGRWLLLFPPASATACVAALTHTATAVARLFARLMHAHPQFLLSVIDYTPSHAQLAKETTEALARRVFLAVQRAAIAHAQQQQKGQVVNTQQQQDQLLRTVRGVQVCNYAVLHRVLTEKTLFSVLLTLTLDPSLALLQAHIVRLHSTPPPRTAGASAGSRRQQQRAQRQRAEGVLRAVQAASVALSQHTASQVASLRPPAAASATASGSGASMPYAAAASRAAASAASAAATPPAAAAATGVLWVALGRFLRSPWPGAGAEIIRSRLRASMSSALAQACAAYAPALPPLALLTNSASSSDNASDESTESEQSAALLQRLRRTRSIAFNAYSGSSSVSVSAVDSSPTHYASVSPLFPPSMQACALRALQLLQQTGVLAAATAPAATAALAVGCLIEADALAAAATAAAATAGLSSTSSGDQQAPLLPVPGVSLGGGGAPHFRALGGCYLRLALALKVDPRALLVHALPFASMNNFAAASSSSGAAGSMSPQGWWSFHSVFVEEVAACLTANVDTLGKELCFVAFAPEHDIAAAAALPLLQQRAPEAVTALLYTNANSASASASTSVTAMARARDEAENAVAFAWASALQRPRSALPWSPSPSFALLTGICRRLLARLRGLGGNIARARARSRAVASVVVDDSTANGSSEVGGNNTASDEWGGMGVTQMLLSQHVAWDATAPLPNDTVDTTSSPSTESASTSNRSKTTAAVESDEGAAPLDSAAALALMSSYRSTLATARATISSVSAALPAAVCYWCPGLFPAPPALPQSLSAATATVARSKATSAFVSAARATPYSAPSPGFVLEASLTELWALFLALDRRTALASPGALALFTRALGTALSPSAPTTVALRAVGVLGTVLEALDVAKRDSEAEAANGTPSVIDYDAIATDLLSCASRLVDSLPLDTDALRASASATRPLILSLLAAFVTSRSFALLEVLLPTLVAGKEVFLAPAAAAVTEVLTLLARSPARALQSYPCPLIPPTSAAAPTVAGVLSFGFGCGEAEAVEAAMQAALLQSATPRSLTQVLCHAARPLVTAARAAALAAAAKTAAAAVKDAGAGAGPVMLATAAETAAAATAAADALASDPARAERDNWLISHVLVPGLTLCAGVGAGGGDSTVITTTSNSGSSASASASAGADMCELPRGLAAGTVYQFFRVHAAALVALCTSHDAVTSALPPPAPAVTAAAITTPAAAAAAASSPATITAATTAGANARRHAQALAHTASAYQLLTLMAVKMSKTVLVRGLAFEYKLLAKKASEHAFTPVSGAPAVASAAAAAATAAAAAGRALAMPRDALYQLLPSSPMAMVDHPGNGAAGVASALREYQAAQLALSRALGSLPLGAFHGAAWGFLSALLVRTQEKCDSIEKICMKVDKAAELWQNLASDSAGTPFTFGFAASITMSDANSAGAGSTASAAAAAAAAAADKDAQLLAKVRAHVDRQQQQLQQSQISSQQQQQHKTGTFVGGTFNSGTFTAGSFTSGSSSTTSKNAHIARPNGGVGLNGLIFDPRLYQASVAGVGSVPASVAFIVPSS